MLGFKLLPQAAALSAAALLLAACSPEPNIRTASADQIRQRVGDSVAELTLVHVWATWCPPCREEFPDLLKAVEQYDSSQLELILVSADSFDEAEAVLNFLQEHGAAGSLIASDLNQDLIETLSPEWGGAIPASFFYRNGTYLAGWEGKQSTEHYRSTIDQLLNTKGGTP